MSVHKAQSGRWVVRYRDAGRNRSKTFSLESDAIRYDAEVRRRRELGELILSRRDIPTLREEAADWLASKSDLSPVTEAHYANLLRLHVLPGLGAMRLVDLRPRTLDEWQRELLKNRKPRTVQQARMVLSQVLTRAVAHEYLQANPLSPISGPTYKVEHSEPATVEQVEAMRAACKTATERALISLLAYAGLRPPQESHGILWADLDGRSLRLSRRNVYGKFERGLKMGRRERTVILPGPVAQEMAELRISLGRPRGLIFARADGGPLKKSDWGNYRRRNFARLRAAAKLSEGFTPYDLRHTCASLMIASGRPAPEVAEQLGHSLQTSVATYQHLIQSMRGQEIVPLDERIAQARSLDVPRKEA